MLQCTYIILTNVISLQHSLKLLKIVLGWWYTLKQKNLKISVMLFLIIITFSANCISVFANDFPDWYYEGTSSDSDLKIEVGSEITPEPPPEPPKQAPPPAQATTPPNPNSVTPAPDPTVPSEVSSTSSVSPPPPPLPPPPKAASEEEWQFDIGVNVEAETKPNSIDVSSVFTSQRNASVVFFAENWWWIVGCSVVTLGLIIGIILRRNKQ